MWWWYKDIFTNDSFAAIVLLMLADKNHGAWILEKLQVVSVMELSFHVA